MGIDLGAKLSGSLLHLNVASFASNARFSTIQPMSEAIRNKALENVQKELVAAKILTKEGQATKETIAEFSFEFSTSLPTAGVVVKGCLDDCNVCEDSLMEEIK